MCDVIGPIGKVLIGKGYPFLVQGKGGEENRKIKENGKWVPFLQKC